MSAFFASEAAGSCSANCPVCATRSLDHCQKLRRPDSPHISFTRQVMKRRKLDILRYDCRIICANGKPFAQVEIIRPVAQSSDQPSSPAAPGHSTPVERQRPTAVESLS